MTPAAVIVLLVAALLVTALWALHETTARTRAEARATRQAAYRRRLGARLRPAHAEITRLRAELADLKDARHYGVWRGTPQAPLAHRGDPDRTAVILEKLMRDA